MDAAVARIHDALPRNSLLIVFTGHGDMLSVRRCVVLAREYSGMAADLALLVCRILNGSAVNEAEVESVVSAARQALSFMCLV
jgi:hypothetical protein